MQKEQRSTQTLVSSQCIQYFSNDYAFGMSTYCCDERFKAEVARIQGTASSIDEFGGILVSSRELITGGCHILVYLVYHWDWICSSYRKLLGTQRDWRLICVLPLFVTAFPPAQSNIGHCNGILNRKQKLSVIF